MNCIVYMVLIPTGTDYVCIAFIFASIDIYLPHHDTFLSYLIIKCILRIHLVPFTYTQVRTVAVKFPKNQFPFTQMALKVNTYSLNILFILIF